jgi:hypothetical protein
VGAYLPTLVAIMFNVSWQSAFARLKEMEPFYQLTKLGGAKLEDSLLLSITGANPFKLLLSSLAGRHWLSLIGSVNMVLVTICTALASETLFISTTGSGCGVVVDRTASTNNDCRMQLAMRPILAWIVGVILFAIFALTVVLILRLKRQNSGIFYEATSIAGIATLYNRSLTQELSYSRHSSSKRYGLILSDDGTCTNSIVELTPAPAQPPAYQEAAKPARKKKKNGGHVSIHPAALAVFWTYLVGVLIIILYYRFVSTPGTGDGLETFMDSQSFGVRLFMTCLGLIIKFYWNDVAKYMHRMAPYRALTSSTGATADQSVLFSRPSHPVTALFLSDSWKHPLLGWVTLMAVFSEILVIVLTAIPFSVARAYLAFNLSVYIGIGIIGLMIVTVPIIIIWTVRKAEENPVPPECIADVFALLSDDVAWRFVALGTLSGIERNRVIRSWQLRYSVQRVQVGEQPNDFQNDWKIALADPTEVVR